MAKARKKAAKKKSTRRKASAGRKKTAKRKVAKRKVGKKKATRKKATANGISIALGEALHPDFVERARVVGEKVRSEEDGAVVAARAIRERMNAAAQE